MSTIKGLKEFCRKHRVPIPSGDDFNLMDFIISVSKHQPMISEYRGSINEISNRLGPESEDWGGCPRCGSNVHTGLSECPICGLDLASDDEFEEEDSSEDALGELDPDYAEEDEEENALDGLVEEDDEEYEEPEDEEEYEEVAEEEAEDESEDEGDEDEYEYAEDEDEEEVEDPEDDETYEEDDAEEEVEEEVEEELEEEPEEESEDEDEYEGEDEIEEEVEPLAASKKQHNRKVFKRQQEEEKAKSRRNTATHAEKVRKRNETRTKIQKAIPQFRKKPSLIEKLKYQHLLVLPGLLGYDKKPTTIGSKEEIQAWVKRKLQEGRAR